jgi:hypothetical protein
VALTCMIGYLTSKDPRNEKEKERNKKKREKLHIIVKVEFGVSPHTQ